MSTLSTVRGEEAACYVPSKERNQLIGIPMTGTEDDVAKRWSDWLKGHLRAKGWSVDDLVRALKAKGYTVSRTQVYRWNRGEQPPSRENAAAVADTLGVDRRQAYLAADHDVDPETPIIADPAEAFVEQIRARGFPPFIEKRLIAEIRSEIEQRRKRLEADLDTYHAVVTEAFESARVKHEAGPMVDEEG